MKTKDQIHLNKRLIERQQLTESDVDAVKDLHLELEMFFDKVEAQDYTDWTISEAKAIVDNVERIEFAMQEAWKFNPMSAMHSWWYQTPHCSCPHMDNQDVMGVDIRYINGDCPLHSLHNGTYLGQRKDLTTKLILV